MEEFAYSNAVLYIPRSVEEQMHNDRKLSGTGACPASPERSCSHVFGGGHTLGLCRLST